jgi:hypothetical protein
MLVGGVLTPLVAPGLERKLGGPGDVLPFMLLMLANLAVTLPLSAFPTVLDGLQRFGTKSAVRLVCLALRVAGIVWVMETQPASCRSRSCSRSRTCSNTRSWHSVVSASCPGFGCRTA